MPIYLMDKAYRITSPNGVGAHRVVVQGGMPGECTVPAGANAPAILGVTMHEQATPGRSVAVRKAGVAEVVAGGPIPVGAPVTVHGTDGRVKAITETAGTKINCLGFAESVALAAGDFVEVFISIHERTA